MIRNLATMTRVGLLAPLSDATRLVRSRITDVDGLRKARVHPIAVLSALRTYQKGRGERGDTTWTPVQQVVDALDSGFYAAFGAVEPAGKRTMLALDVSGSMSTGEIAGVKGLTPREGSVAMAMITAAIEPDCAIMGFSGRFVPLKISAKRSLADNVAEVSCLPFDRTDCAVPMLWALENKVNVDTFVVYTDSETWAGSVHPTVALQRYRQKRGIPAREVVVGMVSNGFTIADPNDAGQLDVVGFDASTPQVISQFSRGGE
jgi:60 kDa SS-A/Ro ribonucleoprotein